MWNQLSKLADDHWRKSVAALCARRHNGQEVSVETYAEEPVRHHSTNTSYSNSILILIKTFIALNLC